MLEQAKRLAQALSNNGTQRGEDSLIVLALAEYLSPTNIKQFGLNALAGALYNSFNSVKRRPSMYLTGPQVLFNYKHSIDGRPIPTLFSFDVVDNEARPGNYATKLPVDLSGKQECLGENEKNSADKIAETLYADSGKFANSMDDIRAYLATENLQRFGIFQLLAELDKAMNAHAWRNPSYEVRLTLTSLQFRNGTFELHTSTFEEGMRGCDGRYGGADSLKLPLGGL